MIAISSARFPDPPRGVVAMFFKPVDIRELVRLVGAHAGRPSSQAERGQPPEPEGS